MAVRGDYTKSSGKITAVGPMLTRDQLRTLFEYNLWANARILGASEALTAEQFTRPLGSSFGSVRDTLAHLYRR